MPSLRKWMLGYGIDPMREWVRQELPSKDDGFAALDLDFVFRRWSQSNPVGKLGFIEFTTARSKNMALYERVSAILRMLPLGRLLGVYAILVEYTASPNKCIHCGHPISDVDEAYGLFDTAKLCIRENKEWKYITHDQFKGLLLDGTY